MPRVCRAVETEETAANDVSSVVVAPLCEATPALSGVTPGENGVVLLSHTLVDRALSNLTSEVTMVHGLETMERLNSAPQETQSIKRVVVANCTETGEQAIYIDGNLEGEYDNVFAFVIVQAVGGSSIPMTLEQRDIAREDCLWPKLLDDLPSEND